MAVIFISHSRRDRELIQNVQTLLINVGHTPIIEEFIAEEQKAPIPRNEIESRIQQCAALFLFLTDEVMRTEHTKSWVTSEAAIAHSLRERVFVFEREGLSIPYPLPYTDDYMIFNPRSIEDVMNIQKLSKGIGGIPGKMITGALGALIGSAFGPVGTLIGAIGGLIFGPEDQPPIPGIRVTCPNPNCKANYNYWSPDIPSFLCPCCRQRITVEVPKP